MFGSGHNDSPIVREQCIAIAKDRVAHVKGEKRAQALEMVALTLELWKRGRADADGTIEIDVAVPSKGLLDMDSWTRAMASQGLLPEKKRRPAAELKPWECAGSGVQSDADLFERLLYTDHYAPAEKIEQLLGPGVPLALLVERDGKTMPVDSLVFAVRYLWIIAFWALKSQRIELHQFGSKAAAAKAQRLIASKLAAETKHHDAEMARAQWKTIAGKLWRGDLLLKDKYVAAKVVEELKRQRAERLLKGEKAERIPALGTVMNHLGGVRNAVRAELARRDKRR
jgi:hypothetical protein